MLMSEFTERTHYTPDADEYYYIEQAYYEFDGDKNEFCKWWLKENNSGRWKRELNLRKTADRQYRELYDASEKYRRDTEETLEFYRKRMEDYYSLKEEVKQLTEIKNAREKELGELRSRYIDADDELNSVRERYDELMDALAIIKSAII